MFDQIEQAIYDVVHDHPGGATKLSALVNMNAGTLSNKANPGMEYHQLTVKEAVAIQFARQDFRILAAEAAALGFAIVRLGDFDGVPDLEILTAYANYHSSIGLTATCIAETLEDQKVTRSEFERVRREFFNAASTGLEFLKRMEALIDD